MIKLNVKTLIRKWLWFLNMGSVFSWLTHHRNRRDRPFFFFEGETYTYENTYNEAARFAGLFHSLRMAGIASGELKAADPLPVGLYMDNTPEFIFAVFGAALSNATIFGINTGFRGQTLVNVINQSAISLLLADATTLKEVNRALPEIHVLGSDSILLAGQPVDDPADAPIDNQAAGFKHISEVLPAPGVYDRKKSKVPIDNFSPIIVIYTSGTTGAPKGVPCSHLKVLGAGQVIRTRIGLIADDRGYVCMPLFHSNAWFIALMPIFLSGGSFLLKRRFSASAFEDDILEYGVTYMNYVGQPVHYILMALEKKYGGGEKVKEALAQHPKNQFRIAHGNGATSVDRKKLIRYLGMEHVYEMYGSTEAPITTVVMPGNPIDCVGEIASKDVVILDEESRPCPAGILDSKGQLTNYEAAVGEISKKIKKENLFFDGYFKNEGATEKKFRDGYYRSGDLGHICVVDGKRFLYFDGRTDDWIRKDGENFSGENVLPFVLNLPDVELAAAYGAPCAISDEKVMAAIQLKKGTTFNPKDTFDFFIAQQDEGGMDPKWMPDYIRIVEEFTYTHQTQKILIRPLKRQHFNVDMHEEMQIYYRGRGDDTYNPLTAEAYEGIKQKFAENGRQNLLNVG